MNYNLNTFEEEVSNWYEMTSNCKSDMERWLSENGRSLKIEGFDYPYFFISAGESLTPTEIALDEDGRIVLKATYDGTGEYELTFDDIAHDPIILSDIAGYFYGMAENAENNQ